MAYKSKVNGKKAKASYGVNKSLATAVPPTPSGIGLDNQNDARNNRRMTRGEAKEKLQTDPTKDYHYTKYNYFGELFVQNIPLWRLWTGRMMLTSDPIVSFSMNIRNAALMAAEVVVEAKKPEVAEWVQKQWDYLWNYHRVSLLSAKELGFAPMQTMWKEDEKGNLNICGLKEFAPEDCKGQEKGGRLVGFRVKGGQLFFPQGLWINFDSKYGNAYGNPITRRQYPAWYEKWMERGAKRLQQLRMIKDAYIGDIFWYPPDMNIELPDGTVIPWRDILREIGEARMSGGAMTLPLKLDSNGHELTRYQPPTPIPGATEIFNWVEYCDENILRGGDIPFEVVQAASTGSGFSGRSIPFLVLLSVCNTELGQTVQQTDERSIRPVASLNFGGDPEYTIKPRSLVESFSADIQGSSLAGGSIGGPVGGEQGVPQAVQQQYAEGSHSYYGERKTNWFVRDNEAKLAQTDHHEVGPVYGFDPTRQHKPYVHHATESEMKSLVRRMERQTGRKHNSLEHLEAWGEHAFRGYGSQHAEGAPEVKEAKFSSTQFNLPGDLAFEVRQLAEQIPSEDLAEDGREINPHITVKYGLHTNDPEEVRQAVQDLKPVPIQIGKASIFQCKDDEGKPRHDVVNLEVESSALHDLNNNICQRLECTDTYPEYKPHITLAYVKPGLGDYWAKRLNSLEGRVAVFDRLIFSNKMREHTAIKLLGQAQFNEAPEDEDAWDDDVEEDSDVEQFGEFSKPAHLFQVKKVPHEEGHHYHATNEENLHDIAVYGGLRTHRPSYGTDQRAWPDGKTEKRSYWHHNPETVKQFAPTDGKPVILRTKRKSIRKESTGDSYTTKAIRSKHLEYLGESGKWHPVTSLVSQHTEGEHSLPFFNSDQFAEGYLSRLREFIGKGMEAAKNRVQGASRYIRTLDPFQPLQTLAGLIEEQIRKLTPLLGNDLFSDAFPSSVGGSLDVLSRVKPPETPLTPEGSVAPPVAPGTVLEIQPTEVPATITLPAIQPIPPALTELLFPPEVPHEPEVHLPAIKAAVEALDASPVAVGSNYLETAQKVKKGSFAITGELTEKAVADVRQVLSKVIQEGKPQKEFIETVATRLESEGSPLSPAHLENVFRTNTMSAYANAQFKAVQNPLVVDAFPYVMRSATRDARVREQHWAMESLGLNGTNIYRVDDPVWQKFRAPWSYNCRCRDTFFSVEQAAKKGVKEAEAWLERAKGMAQSRGGSFYQYLGETAPAVGEHVEHPPFDIDPAFDRDLVAGV